MSDRSHDALAADIAALLDKALTLADKADFSLTAIRIEEATQTLIEESDRSHLAE